MKMEQDNHPNISIDISEINPLIPSSDILSDIAYEVFEDEVAPNIRNNASLMQPEDIDEAFSDIANNISITAIEDIDEDDDESFSPNPNILEGFKVINFYYPNGNIKSEREFNSDEIALRNAHIHNKVLTGTLVGTHTTKLGVVANVSYGRFNIIIPAIKMCIDINNIVSITRSNLEKQLKRPPTDIEIKRSSDVKIADVLNRMLGAEIRFCIRGEKEGIIAGDRELAEMRYLRWFYFSSRNPNIINENSEVTATVVATYFNSIRVNINGYEKKLIASDLISTGEYDLRNKYYVGDTVKLIITKLDRSRVDTTNFDTFAKTYKNMKVEAKTKEALEINYTELNSAYPVRSMVIATIKNIRKNGTYTLLLPNGAMAIGYPPAKMSQIAMPGDKIAVLITGTSEDGKRLKCEVKRFIAKR